MKLVRAALLAALVVGGSATAACGGSSESPADRVTQPIDKARDTADVADQREADIQSRYDTGGGDE